MANTRHSKTEEVQETQYAEPAEGDLGGGDSTQDQESSAANGGSERVKARTKRRYQVFRKLTDDEVAATGFAPGDFYMRIGEAEATKDTEAIETVVGETDGAEAHTFVAVSRFNERKPRVQTRTRRLWD